MRFGRSEMKTKYLETQRIPSLRSCHHIHMPTRSTRASRPKDGPPSLRGSSASSAIFLPKTSSRRRRLTLSLSLIPSSHLSSSPFRRLGLTPPTRPPRHHMACRLDPVTSSTSSEPHLKAVDLRPRPHGQHRLLPPPASRPDSLPSPPSLPSLPTKRNRVDAPGPPPRDTLLEEGEVKEEEDVDERPEGMGTEIEHEGERDDGGR